LEAQSSHEISVIRIRNTSTDIEYVKEAIFEYSKDAIFEYVKDAIFLPWTEYS
jgi:methionine salvage enolase-phosphatase E1